MTTAQETATTAALAVPEAPAHRDTMTHREVLESLSGILLGMFVSSRATSVVSSSLPRIVSDLHGSQKSST